MLPRADAEAMQLHLEEISANVAPDAHAMVLMDRAGWHTTGKLDAPDNIAVRPCARTGGALATSLLLPSKSPELNPVENIWQYMRSNWLSNRVFEDYQAIVQAGCEAWNKPIGHPGTIRSIGRREWIEMS